jgi:hypothetical protein
MPVDESIPEQEVPAAVEKVRTKEHSGNIQ